MQSQVIHRRVELVFFRFSAGYLQQLESLLKFMIQVAT